MPAPSAAADMTSSARVNPCCATTCPEEVMRRVTRAADSASAVGDEGRGSRVIVDPPAVEPGAQRVGVAQPQCCAFAAAVLRGLPDRGWRGLALARNGGEIEAEHRVHRD